MSLKILKCENSNDKRIWNSDSDQRFNLKINFRFI
jgi:hypothetical protein